LKPKKKYGQHFLTNEDIAEKISNAVLKYSIGNVLEVGPGKGVLTKYLAEAENLKCVEIDRDMVNYLNVIFPNLPIFNRNFLKLDLAKVFENPFVIVGNFPYNISSQIVFKMLDYSDRIPAMVGMFQREMADRIASPPGSKTYGIISVLTQYQYNVKKLFNVSRGNFSPPPNVESSVLIFERKENFESFKDRKLLKTVVKLSFSSRRKMIKNNLNSLIKEKATFEDPIFIKRAEQLGLEDFLYLTQLIEKQNK
jgi:16S rRNA (adenine1518-N6/adenine1519-N6)-dimethyltransferase